MKEAPVFIRSYDLYSWLLDRLGQTEKHAEVARAVLRYSRELLDTLSLAVSRFDTHGRLIEADENATLLRVHLRVARDKDLLNDRQLVYATRELRDIGRQMPAGGDAAAIGRCYVSSNSSGATAVCCTSTSSATFPAWIMGSC